MLLAQSLDFLEWEQLMSKRLHPDNQQDQSPTVASYCCYHSDLAVAEYCDAHYGPDRLGVGNFSARLARLCSETLQDQPHGRALELGCAVGRACFELALDFEQVTGIDYSSQFITIARRIQECGIVRYRLVDEGVLLSDQQVALADLGLADAAGRVDFQQGDALHLPDGLERYDLVLAANLLDRLSRPGRFLAGVHRYLHLGGLLVIASPYDWQEEFTPRRYWLGGRYRAGSPLAPVQQISRRLGRRFSQVGEPVELEFVLRRTARTYHHNISQVTCWRRES